MRLSIALVVAVCALACGGHPLTAPSRAPGLVAPRFEAPATPVPPTVAEPKAEDQPTPPVPAPSPVPEPDPVPPVAPEPSAAGPCGERPCDDSANPGPPCATPTCEQGEPNSAPPCPGGVCAN